MSFNKFNLTISFFTLIYFSLVSCTYAQNCNTHKVEEQLMKRYEKDQSVRNEMIPIAMQYQRTGEGTLKLMGLVGKQNRIDKSNQRYVKNYIEKCGWSDSLSSEAHNAIFIIIQHAGLDFISQYISLVKQKAESNLLAKDDYALMLDRQLMYQGKPQLFGTQTFSANDNVNYVWPIENVEGLSARRDSVNLPPMEEYFKLAEDEMDIKMVWDKKLTLEAAKKMKD